MDITEKMEVNKNSQKEIIRQELRRKLFIVFRMIIIRNP